MDLITKPELLKDAKEEQKERLAGRVYECVNAELQPPLEVAREAAEKAKGRA